MGEALGEALGNLTFMALMGLCAWWRLRRHPGRYGSD